jgi:hypothetical protein
MSTAKFSLLEFIGELVDRWVIEIGRHNGSIVDDPIDTPNSSTVVVGSMHSNIHRAKYVVAVEVGSALLGVCNSKDMDCLIFMPPWVDKKVLFHPYHGLAAWISARKKSLHTEKVYHIPGARIPLVCLSLTHSMVTDTTVHHTITDFDLQFIRCRQVPTAIPNYVHNKLMYIRPHPEIVAANTDLLLDYTNDIHAMNSCYNGVVIRTIGDEYLDWNQSILDARTWFQEQALYGTLNGGLPGIAIAILVCVIHSRNRGSPMEKCKCCGKSGILHLLWDFMVSWEWHRLSVCVESHAGLPVPCEGVDTRPWGGTSAMTIWTPVPPHINTVSIIQPSSLVVIQQCCAWARQCCRREVRTVQPLYAYTMTHILVISMNWGDDVDRVWSLVCSRWYILCASVLQRYGIMYFHAIPSVTKPPSEMLMPKLTSAFAVTIGFRQTPISNLDVKKWVSMCKEIDGAIEFDVKLRVTRDDTFPPLRLNSDGSPITPQSSVWLVQTHAGMSNNPLLSS